MPVMLLILIIMVSNVLFVIVITINYYNIHDLVLSQSHIFDNSVSVSKLNTNNILFIGCFKHTCQSFSNICNSLNLNNITDLFAFNDKCNIITKYFSQSLLTLSPLFMLSFRREYLMFTDTNNNTTVCHKFLINVF
eukprot:256601_1